MNDFCKAQCLQHWGIGKGKQAEKHKYVARVETTKDKYRYFYDLSKYKTYLANGAKKAIAALENAGERVYDATSKVSSAAKKTAKKVSKEFTDDYNIGMDIITNAKKRNTVQEPTPKYVKRYGYHIGPRPQQNATERMYGYTTYNDIITAREQKRT